MCQKHPNDGPVLLDTPESFREKFPDGGCRRPCGLRLDCGHACPLFCHPPKCSIVSKCYQPCARAPCPRSHPCKRPCFEPCRDCTVPVNGIGLKCGHIANMVPCFQADCPEEVKCRILVPYIFEKCGHRIESVLCAAITAGNVICPVVCNSELECGYKCKQACGVCASEGKHQSCDLQCNRNLVCGHVCSSKCHHSKPCPPCDNRCEMRCAHSSCEQTIFDCSIVDLIFNLINSIFHSITFNLSVSKSIKLCYLEFKHSSCTTFTVFT